jgi:hypothetical protein
MRLPYPVSDGNAAIFLQHVPKEPSRQVALGQQQPLVACVLYQPSTGMRFTANRVASLRTNWQIHRSSRISRSPRASW